MRKPQSQLLFKVNRKSWIFLLNNGIVKGIDEDLDPYQRGRIVRDVRFILRLLNPYQQIDVLN